MNARIKIDYQGAKPKVTFGYPDKKNQIRGSMMMTVFYSWIIIWFLMMLGFTISQEYFSDEVKEKVDYSDYHQCTDYYLDYCKDREDLNYYEIIKNDFAETFNLKFLFFLASLLGPPVLIYFPFRRQWDNLFPKYQAWGAKKKIVTFKSKDVIYNTDYYCEIPLFKNIILDYTATKDFSKYLKFFEIREHNFKSYRYKKVKKGKKKKRMQNELLWYAKFYFSKKPQQGKLEVIFK